MKPPDGTFAVTFTGTAREYFGIWIVNLMLSIATLGIWSAWAKVRNRTYILGNTSIAGGRSATTPGGFRFSSGASSWLHSSLASMAPR